MQTTLGQTKRKKKAKLPRKMLGELIFWNDLACPQAGQNGPAPSG